MNTLIDKVKRMTDVYRYQYPDRREPFENLNKRQLRAIKRMTETKGLNHKAFNIT